MKNCLVVFITCLMMYPVISGHKLPVKAPAGHLPRLEVYDLKGRHTTLAALGKNKVTFIDNWFIPCPPCFREMGLLHKLYFKYKANTDVNFMTICRTDTGIVKKFIAKDKSLANYQQWYQSNSGRSDFRLPVYFIPGCNEKIYAGTPLAKSAPDDKRKCPDVQFDFHGYPTILIYDKKGRLIFKKTGFGLNENPDVYMAQLDSVIKSAI